MAVVGAAGLALVACGSGSPRVTSTTTRPVTTPKAAVLAAYRAMWADLVSASRTSDYQSPLLAEHATGQALTLFVQGLARDQLHDIVTVGEPILQPSVTSLVPATHPTVAKVSDCFNDTGWIEYTTSGRRVKNQALGLRTTTAVLAKAGGTWKVTELTIGSVDSC